MQELLSIPWINILILSFPNGLCSFLGALLLSGISLRRGMFQALLMSAIYAPYSFYMYYFALKYNFMDIRVLINVLFIVVLVRIFSVSTWRQALILASLAFICNILSNSIAAFIGFAARVDDVQHFLLTAPYWVVLIWWPSYASMPLLAFLIRDTQMVEDLRRIVRFMSEPGFVSIGMLILLQMVAFATALIDFANNLQNSSATGEVALVLAMFVIFVCTTIIIFLRSAALSEKLVVQNFEDHLTLQMEQLVASVEGQRTGFMSHVAALKAMAEGHEMTEMQKYLDKLNQELSVVNSSLQIGNAFISSMVNAKIIQAENRGVHFQLSVENGLEGYVSHDRVIELVRILGNLIDNGQEAVERMEPSRRWISLVIRKNGPFLFFIVSNPWDEAVPVPECVFEAGVSMKQDGHQGLGLYIARSLAKKIGGSLNFKIAPDSTISFVLAIPA